MQFLTAPREPNVQRARYLAPEPKDFTRAQVVPSTSGEIGSRDKCQQRNTERPRGFNSGPSHAVACSGILVRIT